jgi:hypothetical protein
MITIISFDRVWLGTTRSIGRPSILKETMSIYYFRFEAVPTTNAGDFNDCGGAMINCWIKEENGELASIKASSHITSNGWKILLLEESFLAEDGMYAGQESIKYFEQAKIDGEVYVYHTWPVDPQDDELIN